MFLIALALFALFIAGAYAYLPRKLFTIALLWMWGPALLLFSGGTILSRALLNVNGRIVTSETRCDPTTGSLCGTTYVLQHTDGGTARYFAGPNDPSLQRRMLVGTDIVKDRWRLYYYVNGQRVDDFPSDFYFSFLSASLAMICWGAKRRIRGAHVRPCYLPNP